MQRSRYLLLEHRTEALEIALQALLKRRDRQPGQQGLVRERLGLRLTVRAEGEHSYVVAVRLELSCQRPESCAAAEHCGRAV